MWAMIFSWEYFLVGNLLLEMLTFTQAIKVEVWVEKLVKSADVSNIEYRNAKIFLLKLELELQKLVQKF